MEVEVGSGRMDVEEVEVVEVEAGSGRMDVEVVSAVWKGTPKYLICHSLLSSILLWPLSSHSLTPSPHSLAPANPADESIHNPE